jgi:glutamate racemase
MPSDMSPSQSAIGNESRRLSAERKSEIPVGVFDSGVGGLSVARELMKQAPAQPIIYVADQAHAPYGQRSLAEIRTLAEGISAFLLREGARLIVVACNTASAAALRLLRERFPDTPFVGMEPALKPAAEHTRSGSVGVIATRATFQGELFASLMDRFASGVTVHTQVCPELVPLVEAGEIGSEHTRAALRAYLAPLLAAGIDELVLGCTHYPFLRPLIEQVAGDRVEIVDPAPAVARQTVRVLEAHGWLAGGDQPTAHRFFTSGSPDRFRTALSELLGLDAGVEQVGWESLETLRSVATGGANPNLIPNNFGIKLGI